MLCDQLHNLRRPRQLCCVNTIYSISIFSLRQKCTYNLATTKENEFLGLLRLKSASGTASTIVANVIRAISRNGIRSMHGLLMTTERMQCFALRLRVVGVGKIPLERLESGEIMRSRPIKAGLVKSLAD